MAKRGEKLSVKTIERIREAKLANPTRYWLGKGRSEKTKRKLSESQKGNHNSPRTEFKEGHPAPKTAFKKGHRPWNYIDGRSKDTGPARYGNNWENIKKAVLIRDNFACQHCFLTEVKLHVHHKIPFLLTKDNSMSNLISLCKSCHRKEDARIIKELKKQGIY